MAMCPMNPVVLNVPNATEQPSPTRDQIKKTFQILQWLPLSLQILRDGKEFESSAHHPQGSKMFDYALDNKKS